MRATAGSQGVGWCRQGRTRGLDGFMGIGSGLKAKGLQGLCAEDYRSEVQNIRWPRAGRSVRKPHEPTARPS